MLTLAEHNQRVARLADHELIDELQRVLSQERGTHARLLVHLAEVDARGLYRERAYASMFDYCVQALRMSEAEAYLRIRAARVGREFPRALLMLEAGELNLTAIKLLTPLLSKDSADQWFDSARFKSKRDLEVLIAARFEKSGVSNVIRKLPQRGAPAPTDAPAPLALELQAHPSLAPSAQSPASSPERFQLRPQAPASIEPLGPARYKLQLTASQQLHDKLQQARDLMRHELPDGDLAQLVDKALDLLIADRLKRRFGVGRKPRARATQKQREPQPTSRHIPDEVRRQVVARDGLHCTFVSSDGRRCQQTAWLQLDHEDPYAKGGPAFAANIRVLCRSHNLLHAERTYGRSFIRQRIEQAKSRRAQRRLGPEGPEPVP